MGERAMGVLVPELKDEPAEESPPVTHVALQQAPEDAGAGDVENYMLCPICKQIISSAFLTACGHSFCHLCIVTHLSNKSDCPSCGHYLTSAHIFPNLLLDKVFV